MATPANAMPGTCTKRHSGSSIGLEAGEMFGGGTAQQVGGSGRGVQGKALTGDDAQAAIARQFSGGAQI